MKLICVILCFSFYAGCMGFASDGVEKLFKYFRNESTLGVPFYEEMEPDPLPFNVSLAGLIATDMVIYGASGVHIDYMYVDYVKMKLSFWTRVPYLAVESDFEWHTFLSSSGGWAKVNVTGITLGGTAPITFNDDYLEIVSVEPTFIRDVMNVHMEGLSAMHQAIFNSGGVHLFFDDITKDVMIEKSEYYMHMINTWMKYATNQMPFVQPLYEFTSQFQNQTFNQKMLKKLIGRILKYCNANPFPVPDIETGILGFFVKLSEIKIHGSTNIGSIDDFKMMYTNNHFYIRSTVYYPKVTATFRETIRSIIVNQMWSLCSLDGYGLTLEASMVVNPKLVKSIVSSDFTMKVDWIGNIERYNRSRNSPEKILQTLVIYEKTIQDAMISLFTKKMKPKINSILQNIDLRKIMVDFFKKKEEKKVSKPRKKKQTNWLNYLFSFNLL